MNDLTYRIEGRVLFDKATAGIPAGHKVGFVGRNGSGKTTLLRLIAGELQPDDGGINLPRSTRIGWVTQEAPGGPESLLEVVLAADTERARLLAEAETAHDPGRIADIHERLSDIRAHAAPSRAARILAGLGFDEAAQQRPCSEFSGGWRMRVALAAMLFTEPELLLLDEPTNYLDLEGALWLEDYLARLPPHRVDRQPRPRAAEPGRGLYPASGAGQAHALHGRLRSLRGGTAREAAPRPQAQEEAGRRAPPHRGVYHPLQGQGLQGDAGAEPRQGAGAHAADRRADGGTSGAVPVPQPGQGVRQPADPAGRCGRRLRPGRASAARPRLAARCRRPRRPARAPTATARVRFAKLLAGRLEAMAGRRYASSKIEVGFFAQHQMDDLPVGKTPYEHMSRPDAGGHRGAAAGQAGGARLQHRQGRHQGGEPVGRREGAACCSRW